MPLQNRGENIFTVEPRARLLIGSGYAVAAMILVFSVSDVVMRMLPFRTGETAWRIGAVGTVSGNIATWLLAVLLVAVTAYLLDHRNLLRAVAVVCLASALVMMLIVPLFVLDVLELRRAVRSDTLLPFDVTMIRATLAVVATAAALTLLGVGSWRCVARATRSRAEGKTTSATVVGSPKVAAARGS